MANSSNHYEILEISSKASQFEIKQAYRRLAKRHHPDRNPEADSHEQITQINAAYEVLGDPSQRRFYDQTLSYGRVAAGQAAPSAQRQQRASTAQKQYRQRQTGRESDEHLRRWTNQIYQPIIRTIAQILKPLKSQLNELAADPFDDELLAGFQTYLDDCRSDLQRAQKLFSSLPNPSNVASVAAQLYYCLNQVGDGIDELERFVSCYDEHYLHTGQELFRIAAGLRREAQAAMREVK
ncbi:MAG: DnaJ domain-containing protein [Pegethrix bostrychoides GSE-TBD4-15B]|jgi:molecular chaperone DnaJ|uniref:DnaJ domain-containing protein n=1 Tax=Pegethrix bostrychoides GSE-TBD4-15B TaxID=2839662 RepID=A0A951P9B8_9CYAN|nr:DnaJ domain-containing protein [Pegethrix bostrychoides GSE-TBD4-15B]